MARRHARSFVRPPARTKIWIGTGVAQSTLTGDALTLVASLGAVSLALRPFTVLRTHLHIWFHSDQSATSETPHGAFGQIVAKEQAVAVGATAMPSPSGIDGNPDADWYLWQALFADFLIKDATGFESSAGQQYEVDSKAMRKVGSNEDLVTMVDLQNSEGAILIFQGRRLIQLH